MVFVIFHYLNRNKTTYSNTNNKITTRALLDTWLSGYLSEGDALEISYLKLGRKENLGAPSPSLLLSVS
jgi:hypothetical protein